MGSVSPTVGGRCFSREFILKEPSSSDLHGGSLILSECRSVNAEERGLWAQSEPSLLSGDGGLGASQGLFCLQDGPQLHSFFPEPSLLRSCFPLEKKPHTFSLLPWGSPRSILGALSGLGAQGPPGGPGGPCVVQPQSCDPAQVPCLLPPGCRADKAQEFLEAAPQDGCPQLLTCHLSPKKQTARTRTA